MKVLFLYSSPISEEKSISTSLNKEFQKLYAQANPNDELIIMDLNKEKDLKEMLTSENFGTFFTTGIADKYINLLKSVDKLVISLPMINFNVPIVLKSFLDRVNVADKTFSYKYSKGDDAIGLLTHLKCQILATQGAPVGWYPWGAHVPYLEGALRFLGIHVNPSYLVAGTKVAPLSTLKVEDIIEQKSSDLQKLVSDF